MTALGVAAVAAVRLFTNRELPGNHGKGKPVFALPPPMLGEPLA